MLRFERFNTFYIFIIVVALTIFCSKYIKTED